MAGAPPTLIIPVENQVRELDAKLIIACSAAERGFQVIIGSQLYVHSQLMRYPRGVILAKSMRAVNAMTFKLATWFGHDIIAGDEEALVRFDSPEYYQWRYSRRTFTAISRLLCWGDDDARMFASFAGYAGAPIHVTGNARIDLLCPGVREIFRDKVDAIRAEYGEFVLINTNFAFVNHFIPALNLVTRDNEGRCLAVSRSGRGMSLAFADGMARHQDHIFRAFQALLPHLRHAFSTTRFILRPHPSENHSRWQDLTTGHDNISIVHDGNVVPWLMAARCLLHNGCTTAVEAAVLDVPAITYQPVEASQYDYHLPNSLSHTARNFEELATALHRLLDKRLETPQLADTETILAGHIAPRDGPLAADRVVDVLVDAGYLNGSSRNPSGLQALGGLAGLHGRALVQAVKMALPQHRTGAAHHAHQFPRTTVEDIAARVDALGARLGRFRKLVIRPSSPHVFLIERA